MLDRLEFDQLRETHPERYHRAGLASTSIVEEENGRFVVQRAESEDAHIVRLVDALGHPWGKCGCPGYKYDDGPCSHLCAVWRASLEGIVELPDARVTAVDVDVLNADQELADFAAEPEEQARADGGGRR